MSNSVNDNNIPNLGLVKDDKFDFKLAKMIETHVKDEGIHAICGSLISTWAYLIAASRDPDFIGRSLNHVLDLIMQYSDDIEKTEQSKLITEVNPNALN